MTIRANEHPVRDLILPEHVLVSVYDKKRLPTLVEGFLEICPEVMFYSTGGTGEELTRTLGLRSARHYTSIEQFTGTPEMDGGLVKTLHPKVHAGLLAERNNPTHEEFLGKVCAEMTDTPGVYFDVMVGNVYPFLDAFGEASLETRAETARGNIDIGGPTMITAGAKNWHGVAVLTSPEQYEPFLLRTAQQKGTTLEQRFKLAQSALMAMGEYRHTIGNTFARIDFDGDVRPNLNVEGEE